MAPPWAVQRVLGVARLGASRGAEDIVEKMLDVLRRACSNDELFEETKGNIFCHGQRTR